MSSKNKGGLNAAVLVLGDLNRSPRMLNHCKAISDCMPNVKEISLIGYNGGDIRSDIKNNNKIRQYYISEPLKKLFNSLPRFMFPFVALVKVFLQILILLYTLLFKIPKPDFLILQNPPGIPTIFICSIVCFVRRSKFIIDWHNYGFTILKVNKRNRFICYIAKLYEIFFAKTSHLNFCVSENMQKDLKQIMNINSIVLHDRALKGVFKKLNIKESHELFQKYQE
jgi:beta-1,4-mannosyltransferase